MRQVAVRLRFSRHRVQHRFVRERLQQLVVARAGLVHAGHDRVHDRETGVSPETPGRQSRAGVNTTLAIARGLERPDHGGPDGNDPAAGKPRRIDQRRCRCGDLVRFGQRQAPIERRIAGR